MNRKCMVCFAVEECARIAEVKDRLDAYDVGHEGVLAGNEVARQIAEEIRAFKSVVCREHTKASK